MIKKECLYFTLVKKWQKKLVKKTICYKESKEAKAKLLGKKYAFGIGASIVNYFLF